MSLVQFGQVKLSIFVVCSDQPGHVNLAEQFKSVYICVRFNKAFFSTFQPDRTEHTYVYAHIFALDCIFACFALRFCSFHLICPSVLKSLMLQVIGLILKRMLSSKCSQHYIHIHWQLYSSRAKGI